MAWNNFTGHFLTIPRYQLWSRYSDNWERIGYKGEANLEGNLGLKQFCFEQRFSKTVFEVRSRWFLICFYLSKFPRVAIFVFAKLNGVLQALCVVGILVCTLCEIGQWRLNWETQNLCPESKHVFDLRQKLFFFPNSKICFRNTCFTRG